MLWIFHGSEDTFVANVKIEAWGKYIRNIDEFKKDIFVEDLISGPIIWFDGQAEIGPRALGARSILGNPMSLKTKEELNEIKAQTGILNISSHFNLFLKSLFCLLEL